MQKAAGAAPGGLFTLSLVLVLAVILILTLVLALVLLAATILIVLIHGQKPPFSRRYTPILSQEFPPYTCIKGNLRNKIRLSV